MRVQHTSSGTFQCRNIRARMRNAIYKNVRRIYENQIGTASEMRSSGYLTSRGRAGTSSLPCPDRHPGRPGRFARSRTRQPPVAACKSDRAPHKVARATR